MDTSERRLELVRSVRQEQARNLLAMRQRESILYGNNTGTYQDPTTTVSLAEEEKFSGFKIRFFVAVLLVAFFWLSKHNNWSFQEYDSSRLFETVCETSNSIDFTAFFPYTLEE